VNRAWQGERMDYYRKLHLNQEPFSNSPDPAFFYASPRYLEGLQKLEIAIRLRRGLNLVLGEVGVGKTTLSRVLLKTLEADPERFEIHLILDPGFSSDQQMLIHLMRLFGLQPEGGDDVAGLKDQLQHVLLERGLRHEKVLVLLIDEGQKLGASALEIIRELLNFESNEFKLLQVVVFAQIELWDRIKGMKNLLDRVDTIVELQPLSLHETRAMIQHRLVQAGMAPDRIPFTEDAIKRVHRAAEGHPRRIVSLCHHAMLRALILGSERVTGAIVKGAQRQRQGIQPMQRRRASRRRWSWAAVSAFVAMWAVVAYAQRDILVARLYSTLGLPSLRENIIEAVPEVPASELETKTLQSVQELDWPEPAPEIEREAAPTPVQVPAPSNWSPERWFREHPLKVENSAPGRKIVVKKGETLSEIVKRHYGVDADSRLMQAIISANKQLTNPNLLMSGETLVLPSLDEPSKGFYSELMGWFPDEDRAASWAMANIEGGDAIFIVRTGTDGVQSYGVFKGIHESPEVQFEGARRLAWVYEDDVLMVYGEAQGPSQEDGL
jgi:general secretion pathway protein A